MWAQEWAGRKRGSSRSSWRLIAREPLPRAVCPSVSWERGREIPKPGSWRKGSRGFAATRARKNKDGRLQRTSISQYGLGHVSVTNSLASRSLTLK